MLIEVYHFSPIKGLVTLIPQKPSHPDYCDIKGVYFALSLEMCKIWANALNVEGYWKPPFYIYKGFADINILRKIVAVDPDCEKWELQRITFDDTTSDIDQVVAIKDVEIKEIEIYIP
jgi:hypothetical protein